MKQNRVPSLDTVATLAREAPLDAGQWRKLLDEIGMLVGAPSAVLFSPMQGLPDPLLAANNAQLAEHLAAYEAHWMAHDPWLEVSSKRGLSFAAGETTVGTQLLDRADYRKTPFYNEFGRAAGMASMMALRIADGRRGTLAPVTMIAFHRGAGADDFDAAETALLSACFPHLHRAVETHAAFRRARCFDTAVQEALDSMAQPVWVLRDDATVDHANRRACDVMRRAAWLSQSNDRLVRIGDLDHAAIRAAIAPLRGHAAPVHTAAYVERGRAQRAIVRVAPLRGVQAYAAAWPNAVALLSLELPPELDARAWVSRLGTQYRLTPAEQRLLERLAAGATLEQVADEQHVARTTVRTHLRSLFDKTGVRRQSELVRLALGA